MLDDSEKWKAYTTGKQGGEEEHQPARTDERLCVDKD